MRPLDRFLRRILIRSLVLPLLTGSSSFAQPAPPVEAAPQPAFPAGETDAAINLHVHTYCSDGSDTPEEVVELAKKHGIRYLAITDHDTTACVERARSEARKAGITVVPGLEVSAEDDSMHILGLNVDIHNASLQKLIETNGKTRVDRAKQTIALLNKLKARGGDIQVDLKEVLIDKINVARQADGAEPLPPDAARSMSEDQLLGQAQGPLTRPDIARMLVKKGYARSSRAAFDAYLGDDAGASVEMEGLPFREVIETIHAAGGLAVLAHPYTIYKFQPFPHEYSGKSYRDFDALLVDMLSAGLDGIEQYKNHFGPAGWLIDLANREGRKSGKSILFTPGSDYHGHSGVGQTKLPALRIPTAEAEKILKALGETVSSSPGPSAPAGHPPAVAPSAEIRSAVERAALGLGGGSSPEGAAAVPVPARAR